jgi:thioredoxin 1
VAKEIKYIRGSYCPFCRQADSILGQLRAENPQYAAIPITIIDETTQQAEADSYGYYYVPCFVIDGKIVFEGVPSEAVVRGVLDKALQ